MERSTILSPDVPPLAADDDGERLGRAIRDFQQGDDPEGSFGVVFDRFYRPLQRFFARKGLSPDLCLDLTQETLLGIYRGLATYTPEARLETWVYKIATTTYLKSLRSARAAKRQGEEVAEVVERLPAADRHDALGEVLQEERRRTLREALHELPDQMRRCLTLRLYHELTYREIAVVLNLSVETVKAHLYQARKRLEASLGEALGA